ncbi:hypothetical protein CMI44_01815 [Candidatus Pacearchaeota archaeon]|jgi:ABC-type Na+ efflux pump permease subunit|nr:hypothetical protein [Candidatus Pacearchaeota archaeon]
MKKGGLFVIIFFLLTNFISAGYNCSVGLAEEDQKEISLNGRTSIKGLGIGLTYSDEIATLEKYSVKLLIDTVKFTLTDTSNSTEVEMKSGADTIELLNLTSNLIRIKVGSDSGKAELLEILDINNRKLFLTSAQGTYPGTATIEGLIGNKEVLLDNTSPTKIESVDDVDYLLELFSASDTNAIIIVKKCEDENAEFIEIAESVSKNETTSNITETNETRVIENETFSKNELNVKKPEQKKDSSLFGRVMIILLIIIIAGGIIILGISIFKKLRNKKQIQETSEATPQGNVQPEQSDYSFTNQE